jgi:hypothetical protein
MLYIPKVGRDAMEDVTLLIKGTSTLLEVIMEMSDGNSSALYHKMMITLPDSITAGEYEYSLSDNAGVLSTGLLVIGDLEIPTEYNKEIAYEQYTE